MPTHITFRFEARIEQADPTGEPCERCDDVPYLFAWVVVVSINGMIPANGRTYLCESCKDVVSEQFRDDPDFHR